MTWRSATDYERGLTLRLLELLPNGAEYAEQLKRARVSQWAGDRSIQFEVGEDVASLGNKTGKLPAEGEFNDEDGVSISVLLHVRNGRLSVLEIFKVDGSDVIKMPPLESLTLFQV
jgi:hypothetical protein